MTTDLETRLRRYGTTLDNASSAHPAPAPELDHWRAPNIAEFELGRTGPSRRRPRSLVAVAALIAAGSVALVATVGHRNAEPPPPATVPDNTPDAVGILWPVDMAAGLAPWFEASAETVSELALQPPEFGTEAWKRLRCTSWTAARQTVTSTSLAGEGYLPAVFYPGGSSPDASNTGRYVGISTLHADIDAATYATNYSQGKDVGYEDTPLPQQDVTINGAPGRLIETDDGIRRVTWSPLPATLVAVETGPGLTRDDLLDIASNVTPTSETLPIALELAATGTDDDGRQVIALGGVFNGEVCLHITSTCAQVPNGPPGPGMNTPSTIYTQSTDFGIAGLATSDIATIRVTRPDGSTTDITPTRQPIGNTQAFAVITSSAIVLTALDATGNPVADTEIAGTEATDSPTPATAPPTTTSENTTTPSPTTAPARCSASNSTEMPSLVGLTVDDARRVLEALCIDPALTLGEPGTVITGPPGLESGTITDQEPAAGTPIPFGAFVILSYQSNTPGPTTTSIPGD